MEDKPPSFPKWVTNLWKKHERSPSILKIPPPPSLHGSKPSAPQVSQPIKPHPAVVSGLDASVAGRYVNFTDQRTGHKFLGQPLIFLPGQHQQRVIEPGSRNALGVPGLWANDTAASMQQSIDWMDDPQTGLFSRNMYQPRDALGCRGMLQDTPYAFDDVLQLGQGLIVYQLTNLKNCSYVAIGFGREKFDARHALIKYLRSAGEGKLKYSSSEVIALSKRVLEAFPLDETALFNKGVALMTEQKFAEAHNSLELLIQEKPDDQLAILHDAAALASMGADDLAVKQLIRAEAISEDGFRSCTKSIPFIGNLLRPFVIKLSQANSAGREVQTIRDKYFSSDIGASGTDGTFTGIL